MSDPNYEKFQKATADLLAVADKVAEIQSYCQESSDTTTNHIGNLAQCLGETMAGWTALVEALMSMMDAKFAKKE